MALPFDHPPDRIAAIDEHDRTLSFGDLDRRAKQLAHLIRGSGIAEGDHVALCLGTVEIHREFNTAPAA